MLVDGALNTLFTSKVFNLELPSSVKDLEDTECVTGFDGQDTLSPDERLDSNDHVENPSLVGDLASAADLYDNVLAGTASGINAAEILEVIGNKIQEKKASFGAFSYGYD